MAGSGSIPYPLLVEKMDREIAILYRGADLSTFSKGGGVGASVQKDDTDALDQANGLRLGGTANRRITRPALQYVFPGQPCLAKLRVKFPEKDQTDLKIKRLNAAVTIGVPVSGFLCTGST